MSVTDEQQVLECCLLLGKRRQVACVRVRRKGASKQIKKRSGGRIKNMQMGLQIGGNKKRGIPLFVSLFRRPGIVLRLPRRKIE